MGIRTIGDLASIDVQELIALFGKWGAVIHDLASGTDNREVRQEEGYRSISREITFEQDTDDELVLVQTLDEMAGELHEALKNEQLRFRTITVKLRDEHFHTRTRSKTIERYSDDPSLIKGTSYRLLGDFLEGSKIRLIGLRLSGFEPKGTRQTTISEFIG
jgi:DNA polymerase IV (DinB-like DNA polymerase)